MRMIKTLVGICGLCLILGLAAAGEARQGAGSSQSPASNAAPPPSAQTAKPQGAKSNAKLDADAPENDDALHLTDEQKDKIKSVREDAKQRVLEVQKDSTLSDDVKER
ncbi:MAG: hypothetical protein WCC67_13285, partial [Candidatus Acidiferrales bacterium]